MPDWDANIYLQFANERTQPPFDLANRVTLTDPRRIVDIGCGPGNSTEVLCRRWQRASVTGLDSSPEMIDAARKSGPTGDYILADGAQAKIDCDHKTATVKCDLEKASPAVSVKATTDAGFPATPHGLKP